jgi:hypothetical protein
MQNATIKEHTRAGSAKVYLRDVINYGTGNECIVGRNDSQIFFTFPNHIESEPALSWKPPIALIYAPSPHSKKIVHTRDDICEERLGRSGVVKTIITR